MARRQNEGLPRRDFLMGVAAGAVGLSLSGPLTRAVFAEEAPAAPAATVKTRTLGRTGLTVSTVIWGCGGLQPGRTALLRAAVDRGLTTFDTAWGYGNGKSEEALGEFVKEIGAAGREKIRIITKTSGYKPPSGSAQEVYAHLKEAVGACLKRLGTDYVDALCWPHGAAKPEHLKNDAVREALLKLKEEKIVRHIGTSTHSNYVEVSLAAIADDFYEFVIPVLNVCTQNAEGAPPKEGGRPLLDTRRILAAAKEKSFGVLAMKVMNPGFLGPNADDLLAKAFPADSPLTRAQKLLKYVVDQEGVAGALVALASAQHLKEAIDVGGL